MAITQEQHPLVTGIIISETGRSVVRSGCTGQQLVVLIYGTVLCYHSYLVLLLFSDLLSLHLNTFMIYFKPVLTATLYDMED